MSKQSLDLSRIPDTPAYRALRRQIALTMMVVLPALCALPLLGVMASGERVAWIIWALLAVLLVGGLTIAVRAAIRIRQLAEAAINAPDQAQNPSSSGLDA